MHHHQLPSRVSFAAMLAALVATVVAVFVLHFTLPSVRAASVVPDGITLYAGPRRDTMKDESFIFYDSNTGEIWVYRNEKLKERYQVVQLGEELRRVQ